MSEETNNGDKKQKMKEKLSEIKSSIEGFIADVNVDDLKKSFGSMMKEAQKDFNNLVNRDLETMKKVLKEEKADFEKKARHFMEQNKKELDTLQSKLDKLVQVAKKATAKKTQGPSSTKKTAKKSAKKSSSKKSPTAKKTTKK